MLRPDWGPVFGAGEPIAEPAASLTRAHYDVGHSVKMNVWPMNGSRGAYNEARRNAVSSRRKIARLQQAKAEGIDHQQSQGRSR